MLRRFSLTSCYAGPYFFTASPVVGSALPSRIRKALAALRSVRRRIVEDGRDIYKGLRTMGVPVARGRQSGPDGGFLSQPEPGRQRRQIVSP
jgi:hypothetical protein